MSPHWSRLSNCTTEKGSKILIVFFIIFWMFSSISKKAQSCKVPLSMCCITYNHGTLRIAQEIYSVRSAIKRMDMQLWLKITSKVVSVLIQCTLKLVSKPISVQRKTPSTQRIVLMHPSKETLNSPFSRVDADSTSRRHRILRRIFSGVGESWPN